MTNAAPEPKYAHWQGRGYLVARTDTDLWLVDLLTFRRYTPAADSLWEPLDENATSVIDLLLFERNRLSDECCELREELERTEKLVGRIAEEGDDELVADLRKEVFGDE